MSDDTSDWAHQQALDQQEQEEIPMQVYKAINAVMRDLSAEGISKHRRNTQQGYQFRGIDDVYNALSSSLSTHGLVMLPRVLSRQCQERATAKGGALFYVMVDVEFDLVCAEDGSRHTIRTWGEAMDSADKATNKAMSAAYKYAAMQAFCIPTEGDNDADATTHDVQPESKKGLTAEEWADKMRAAIDAAETVEKLTEIDKFVGQSQAAEALKAELLERIARRMPE